MQPTNTLIHLFLRQQNKSLLWTSRLQHTDRGLYADGDTFPPSRFYYFRQGSSGLGRASPYVPLPNNEDKSLIPLWKWYQLFSPLSNWIIPLSFLLGLIYVIFSSRGLWSPGDFSYNVYEPFLL